MLPLIRRSMQGRIVFVSSGVASLTRNANPNDLPIEHMWIGYSASKASVNMLMVQLAAELRGTRIKVNSVCPGIVRTDMNGGYGELTVQEGAVASVRYAILDDDGPSGGFFNAQGPIPW
jgi:NAD(P)-dependent dehydrogenase (short-subunit alcohol dehydrogenase family)